MGRKRTSAFRRALNPIRGVLNGAIRHYAPIGLYLKRTFGLEGPIIHGSLAFLHGLMGAVIGESDKKRKDILAKYQEASSRDIETRDLVLSSQPKAEDKAKLSQGTTEMLIRDWFNILTPPEIVSLADILLELIEQNMIQGQALKWTRYALGIVGASLGLWNGYSQHSKVTAIPEDYEQQIKVARTFEVADRQSSSHYYGT